MGLGDFFKNLFGKKTCAFCGGECGMLNRTKIKGDEYICGKCDDMCSFHIKKSRFTKDQLAEHIEYMKRSDRIYKEVALTGEPSHRYPSATARQGLEFFDDIGMFRIIDGAKDGKEQYPKELFRYDQVTSYEPYLEESEEKDQNGAVKTVFRAAGIKIRFGGGVGFDMTQTNTGLRAHPYITDEVKVCFATNERERENYLKYAENAIHHFNRIFGVHDEGRALFGFGMSKQEKRDLMGAIGFAKTAVEAVKVAKDGGELSEEKAAEIRENMDAMRDAQTNGLAKYTRAADAAEAKI